MIAEYDPFSPAVLDDPARPYSFLHGDAPVHRFGGFEPPFYTLSRYHDVENALRDIVTYSSEFGQGPRFTPPAGMLSNPPQHTFFRNLVQKAFTPKAIDALSGRVAGLANELGLNPAKVAVERNLEIVPRSTLADVVIGEGDRLEIVHFVGGGQSNIACDTWSVAGAGLHLAPDRWHRQI